MVKKKPVFGALPMLHMPKKSNASNKLPKRPYRSIVNEILPPDVEEVKQYIYKNFKEFCVRVSKIKTLPKWKISQLNDRMLFQLYSESLNLSLPKFEIIIDDSLGFTVSSFGWLLPETHLLYLNYRRSIRNVNIIDLVSRITAYLICNGVKECSKNTNKIIRHCAKNT